MCDDHQTLSPFAAKWICLLLQDYATGDLAQVDFDVPFLFNSSIVYKTHKRLNYYPDNFFLTLTLLHIYFYFYVP
jgi:hypothetical protein